MAEYKLSYTASDINARLGEIDNVVKHTQQDLTEEQKAQARANIGANVVNHNICTFLDAYTAWCKGESFPIAFYGDSTFAGTGTSGSEYAFSAILQNMLREECGANATIYNVGAAGQSLPWALENFETHFGESGSYGNARMVGIGFGINDRLSYTTYQEYKNGVYEKLESLVTMCFERGIQPFLVTSQATMECGVRTNYTQYVLRDANSMNVCANGAKKELAEKYGIPLVDLHSATAQYLANSGNSADTIIPDGLHFGDTGHKFEAEFLFSKIVPRSIVIDGEDAHSLGFTSQNLRYAVPEDKLTKGGNFKVYADYEKSDSVDTKIFDAYVFVENAKTVLKAYKNDGGSTYVKVNEQKYSISSCVPYICDLDIGLHHLEVYTGESTYVNFHGFMFDKTPDNVSLLIDTENTAVASSYDIGASTFILMFKHKYVAKTTALSGKKLKSIVFRCVRGGTITLGKVSLNEYESSMLTKIAPKQYTISEGMVEIDLNGLEVGEHETLFIGDTGDTAAIQYLSDCTDLGLCQINAPDTFATGVHSVLGFSCRVYEQIGEIDPVEVLLADTSNIAGTDHMWNFNNSNDTDIMPWCLMFEYDSENKKTLLSGKKINRIVLENANSGRLTFGTVSLTDVGNSDAQFIPYERYLVTKKDGKVEILFDGLGVGENETLWVGTVGDTAAIYYTSDVESVDSCRFTTRDSFIKNSLSAFALKCKIYTLD